MLLVLAAAAVNAGIGVLVAIEAARSRVAVPAGLVVAVVAISVVYGAALVTAVLVLRRGTPWGRSAVLALSSLSLLALFALNVYNLAVILLLVSADVLLYRPPVSEWVRGLRGLSQA